MKITHSSLSQKVKEILRQQIIKQELPPGVRLKEDEIAEELGISRTPVREALRILIESGLAEKIPRRGIYVIKLTRKDVQEIYTIRTVLEGLATRLATPFFSNEELQAIDDDFTEAENELEEGDFQLFLKVDTEFHDMIIEKSQNERLKNMLNNIHDQIMIFRTWNAQQNIDEVLLAMQEHKAVLDALMDKNVSLAEKRMKEHIERVKQHLLANYPFKDSQKQDKRD